MFLSIAEALKSQTKAWHLQWLFLFIKSIYTLTSHLFWYFVILFTLRWRVKQEIRMFHGRIRCTVLHVFVKGPFCCNSACSTVVFDVAFYWTFSMCILSVAHLCHKVIFSEQRLPSPWSNLRIFLLSFVKSIKKECGREISSICLMAVVCVIGIFIQRNKVKSVWS